MEEKDFSTFSMVVGQEKAFHTREDIIPLHSSLSAHISHPMGDETIV